MNRTDKSVLQGHTEQSVLHGKNSLFFMNRMTVPAIQQEACLLAANALTMQPSSCPMHACIMNGWMDPAAKP
jgi:hypothetical protein